MIKLKDILLESQGDATVSDMKTWFLKCIHDYFPEHKSKVNSEWKLPKFLIKPHPSFAGWFSAAKFELGLNRDYIRTPHARGIVYHETIHYIEYYVFTAKQYNQINHGKFFHDAMNKINSGEGADFVKRTERNSDYPDATLPKSIWTYLLKTSRGEFLIAFSRTRREDHYPLLKKQVDLNLYKAAYEMQTEKLKFRLGSTTKGGFNFDLLPKGSVPSNIESYKIY